MSTARSLQTRPAARPARRGVNGRAGGRFPHGIASGGQSGVDRAALDAALAAGLDTGGWCPRGRRAEDGIIAGRYRLREAPLRDPAVRTRLNVRDADATLVLLLGPPDRGTVTTMKAARALGRRLFVADLRAPAPEEQSDAERGAALFDWKGSLHVDRAAGTGQMLESVEMSHTRASDGAKTLLECARLRATFFPDGGDEASLGGLRSAIADTHVYLRTDTRELTADLLEYDPDAGVARALADDAGRVRMLDRTTGAPMSAAALVWDLNTDRVDVVDPGTITIPR